MLVSCNGKSSDILCQHCHLVTADSTLDHMTYLQGIIMIISDFFIFFFYFFKKFFLLRIVKKLSTLKPKYYLPLDVHTHYFYILICYDKMEKDKFRKKLNIFIKKTIQIVALLCSDRESKTFF